MAFTLKKILVPTDFSDLSGAALRTAALLAEASGAEVELLYADPFLPPPHFLSSQVTDMATMIESSKQHAQSRLDSLRTESLGSIRSTATVVEDLPVTAIIERSEAGADLIVMGTHGRSGFNRFMLGSVSERVLRESSVPLLLVRKETAATAAPTRILCPVNESEAARAAAEHAISLAALTGGRVTLLHVAERTATAEQGREAIDRFAPAELRGRASVSVETLVLHGDPAEEVIVYAREHRFDLIVLGAQHRRFVDTSVIGGTTVKVTRHAECPVLVIAAGR
jgi:nucleotide-binding universal stress UspA family protein